MTSLGAAIKYRNIVVVRQILYSYLRMIFLQIGPKFVIYGRIADLTIIKVSP